MSEIYNGVDEFMRLAMRIGSQFEAWACVHIHFNELTDVWPYLLADKFGDACLATSKPTALVQFDDSDCLRIALFLRLPIIASDGLPVPLNFSAPNPILGSSFCAFRIQTVRNSLKENEPTPFVSDDDPFDAKFGNPYFALYGVGKGGCLEHIADRNTYNAALHLVEQLAPGVEFPKGPHTPQAGGAIVSKDISPEKRTGFCIFIHTVFQGRVPTVSDGEGKYIVFATELEAQKEIADNAMTRLQEFLDDERDFDDAITVEEYVEPVTVNADGSFTDGSGKSFSAKAE